MEKDKEKNTCAILLTLHKATNADAAVSRQEGRSPIAGSGRVRVCTKFLIPSVRNRYLTAICECGTAILRKAQLKKNMCFLAFAQIVYCNMFNHVFLLTEGAGVQAESSHA